MQVQCANALCQRPLTSRHEITTRLHSRSNLCSNCWTCVRSTAVPLAGFIPSIAVNSVVRQVLKHINPSAEEISTALRYARGSRYRGGPWHNRPTYRIAPLKYARAATRLPHLLVGRRTAPSALCITSALVQCVLAGEILGTGELYNRFLAGGTFFGRRGLCVPAGRKAEVLTGDAGYSKWTLGYQDLSILGTHAFKSAAKLGMDRQESNLRAFIVVAYMNGLRAGDYHPPVAVPWYSMATNFLGDHPHDHQFARKADVPRKYRKAIRRSSGLVNKAWPMGIDPRSHLIPQVKPEVRPAPQLKLDTDWIFA